MGEFKEHYWGDNDVDWGGINDAASFIARGLRRFRVPVRDWKEKFGTVRIYTGLGWTQFYEAFYPGYCWIKPWWPNKLDHWLSYDTPVLNWVNKVVVPIHIWAYVWYYTRAVRKWPHLYNEIVAGADHGKLFEGKLPGYKHGDYWQKVKSDDTDGTE